MHFRRGDWPDATWKSENAGKHLPPQSPTVLDMAKIKQIASHIRKWVPAVLSIQDDDEEAREAEKLSFESCLTYLDGLQVAAAEATTGSCGSPCPGGNRAVAAFKPEFLIRCVLAARQLRHKQNLKSVIVDNFIPLLPQMLRPHLHRMLEDGRFKFPSKASASRHQLVVDTAFSLWRQKFLSPRAGFRFLFADSSPQGGRDWMIVKYRFLAADLLLDTFSTVLKLARGEEDNFRCVEYIVLYFLPWGT